jgi:hypothetical protein
MRKKNTTSGASVYKKIKICLEFFSVTFSKYQKGGL